jgi:hypothetical protein
MLAALCAIWLTALGLPGCDAGVEMARSKSTTLAVHLLIVLSTQKA